MRQSLPGHRTPLLDKPTFRETNSERSASLVSSGRVMLGPLFSRLVATNFETPNSFWIRLESLGQKRFGQLVSARSIHRPI